MAREPRFDAMDLAEKILIFKIFISFFPFFYCQSISRSWSNWNFKISSKIPLETQEEMKIHTSTNI